MRVIMGPDPWYFLWSLASGIVLGLLYDFLRVRRKIFIVADIIVNIEDILFIILGGGVAVWLAYTVNNGFFRIYSLISIVIGFCLYRLMIGGRLVNLLVCLYCGLCKGVSLALRVLLMPARYIIKLSGRTVFVTLGGFCGRIKSKRFTTKVKKGDEYQ